MPKYVVSVEGRLMVGQEQWKKNFKDFVNLYKCDIPNQQILHAQLDMWNIKWRDFKGTLPTTITKVLQLTDKDIFPSIYESLRILGTVPVTTCTCERSISGLRRLKTWMRNTMTEERLNSLAVIMINRDIKINDEKVVDAFASKHKRRMALSNIFAN